MVGDAGDGLADGASYCLGAGRELERGLAVGAVYQHQHGGNLLKFQGKMEGTSNSKEKWKGSGTYEREKIVFIIELYV